MIAIDTPSSPKGDFHPESRETACINEIRAVVGDKKALVMVSGGVDSAVCAALMVKALGSDKVVSLHVDNGFMRTDESLKVIESLRCLGLNLKVVDASETFYNATTSIQGRQTNVERHAILPQPIDTLCCRPSKKQSTQRTSAKSSAIRLCGYDQCHLLCITGQHSIAHRSPKRQSMSST